MPPRIQWPELLEEQAYLVQMLSESAHDSGALEYTCHLLDIFHADLRSCTMQVAELEREYRESSSKYPESKLAASASRFYHKVTGSTGSDKDKRFLGQSDKNERLLTGWTRKRTLSEEVRNLEVKAQCLQRRRRHYDELQSRLSALYARIFDGKKSLNREVDEAEEEARRAQRTLHEIQKTLDQHKTLTALLTQGDFALVNAARHLNTADPMDASTQVEAARKCAAQTSVVVDQAKRIDPSFFEQDEAPDVLKAEWFTEVFYPASPGNPQAVPLLQALNLRHTVLSSLISRAQKRTDEQNATAHRAAHRCFEARTRRDNLKRRVLVAYAHAEAQNDATAWAQDDHAQEELGKDGSARLRVITTGLDTVIPVMVPQRPPFPAPTSSPSEIQQRIQGSSRAPPLAQPQPRAPPSKTLLEGLMLDTVTLPTNSYLSSSPSSNTQVSAQGASASLKVHVSSSPNPMLRQAQPSPQNDRILPPGSATQPTFSPRDQLQVPSTELIGNQRFTPPQFQSQTRTVPNAPQDIPRSYPISESPQPPQRVVESMQPLAPKSSNKNSVPLLQYLKSTSDVNESEVDQAALGPKPQRDHHQPSVSPSKDAYLAAGDSVPSLPNKSSPVSAVRIENADFQFASGTSRSSDPSPTRVQARAAGAPSASQRPVVHGILKLPSVALAGSQSSTTGDADAWGGVKAGSASRPQPKLKTMFNLLRGAESSKSTAQTPTQPAPQPPPKENPRAALQKLRFEEGVQIIPRPAVDSDPYEDEDDNGDEVLPPSPQRGSMVWTSNQVELMIEDDESSGHTSEPDHHTSSVNRTDRLKPPLLVTTLSSGSTSTSSLHSASSFSPLHYYYMTPDDEWKPCMQQSNVLSGKGEGRGEGSNPSSRFTGFATNISKNRYAAADYKEEGGIIPWGSPSENVGYMNMDDQARVASSQPTSSSDDVSVPTNHPRGATAPSRAMESNHELLNMLPSPPRSGVLNRDLLFTH